MRSPPERRDDNSEVFADPEVAAPTATEQRHSSTRPRKAGIWLLKLAGAEAVKQFVLEPALDHVSGSWAEPLHQWVTCGLADALTSDCGRWLVDLCQSLL